MKCESRKIPNRFFGWEDIPLTRKGREKLIYGSETPIELTWEERLQKAKNLIAKEPWGLKLHTYPSPFYAEIGGLVARRKMDGGPWTLKHWGKLLVSDSLEELFLQVVERLDNVYRPPAGDMTEYPHGKPDYKGAWEEDPEPETLRFFHGSQWGQLPSECFYAWRANKSVKKNKGYGIKA